MGTFFSNYLPGTGVAGDLTLAYMTTGFQLLRQAEHEAVGNNAALARIRWMETYWYMMWKYYTDGGGYTGLSMADLSTYYTDITKTRDWYVISYAAATSIRANVAARLATLGLTAEQITALQDFTTPTDGEVATWMIEALGPEAVVVTTLPATGVSMTKDGATSGNFTGSLDSLGGFPSANVSFEYGTTVAYGTSTANQTLMATANYTASLPAGWTPGQTYHFRTRGDNGVGTAYGGDQAVVLTMPTVATFTNTVTPVAAVLRGIITNTGVTSSMYVRISYGTTPALGSSTVWQTVSGTGIFFTTIVPPSVDTVLYYRADVRVGATISSGSVVATGVPSAVGGSLMSTTLRVVLAAIIVVSVALIGLTLGPVAMLIAATIGIVRFAIVSALISTI
jgi:hypothetical protein